MNQQRFASVWDALEDTPEAAENMKLRSSLMMALRNHLLKADMSQADAAKLVRLSMRAPLKSAFDPKPADLGFFFAQPSPSHAGRLDA